jgi:predicted membrane chloride channel (bestrophin family)
MKTNNLALELVLLVCGVLPLGIASTVYWFTTGKVPHWLIYALIAVITGCVIAGIEELFESRHGNDEELKKHKG